VTSRKNAKNEKGGGGKIGMKHPGKNGSQFGSEKEAKWMNAEVRVMEGTKMIF